MNVLIISASMGAGHDGAAKELQRRLRAQGHDAEVKDFLRAFPCRIGTIVRLSYEWELKWAPWSYEATYRMWYRMPSLAGPLVAMLTLLTRWRIRRWVRDTQADAVVSTYPLASLTLGRARQTGKLRIPVSTYITDFAVHPLWTHRGVDLHLAVHERSADAARIGSGREAKAPGPLVSDRFLADLPDRVTARATFSIADDERVVLLVAGSWGVGAIRRTFEDIIAAGWMPLVVCGRNERLKRRLERRGIGLVLGWTDQMPLLMAAADVLVENAGGLTCMEAFAAGLPVVSYRPIAGHGRGNAKDMEAAGVAAFAEPGSLATALDATLGIEGARRRLAGQAMFAGDAAVHIAELAATAPRVPLPVAAPRDVAATSPVVVPLRPRRHPVLRPAAIAAAIVGSVATGTMLTSVGVGVAAAHGMAVAHAPRHSSASFVAIRLSQAAADDPRVPAALAAAHVTAIVSGQMATVEPAVIAHLARAGVDLANGGWGAHRGHALSWAKADVVRAAHAIETAGGGEIRTFVAGRSVDGFVLASAQWENQRVVLSRTPIHGMILPTLRPGGVYCINIRNLSADQVLAILAQIERQVAAGATVAPLSQLR
ncbi:MAG: MGDG synthase family glycosyltransferase [Acidimicrobiales bacterium]